MEEYYDKLSTSYDQLYDLEQLRKHHKVAAILGNKTFEIAVDIGCGTGRLLENVGSRFAFAVGIDISSKMLRGARERLEREKVELVRADSKALPIRSTSVECVLTISLLDSSNENCPAQMSEMKRIVGQNGTLAFTIFHPEDLVLRLKQFGLPCEASAKNVSKIETLYVVQLGNTAENRPGQAGSQSLTLRTSR